MKILPITSNNLQNISIKGSTLEGANMICRAHKSLWRRPFPQSNEPFIFSFGDLLFNTDYLNTGDAKIFEGKTISEIQGIRERFKEKAEANILNLEKLVKKFFPSSSYFNIEKSKDDSKLHVVLKKNWKETIHDLGIVEFSEKNNSLTDIDKMSELIEKLKNLTQDERRNIYRKFGEELPEDRQTIAGPVIF